MKLDYDIATVGGGVFGAYSAWRIRGLFKERR
jgi:hypothetical protein